MCCPVTQEIWTFPRKNSLFNILDALWKNTSSNYVTIYYQLKFTNFKSNQTFLELSKVRQ